MFGRMRFAGAMLVLAVLVLPLLSGCGASPDGVVEDFLTRVGDVRLEGVEGLAARAQQADVRQAVADFRARIGGGDPALTRVFNGLAMRLADVSCETLGQNGTQARVKAELSLRLTANDKDFLGAPNGAVGLREVRAEGWLVFDLVKEEGRWRIDLAASERNWREAFQEF